MREANKLGQVLGSIEKRLKREAETKIDKDLSLPAKQLLFNERLQVILRPRDRSDRTSFSRISKFLVAGVQANQFDDSIFETVLRFAREAARPESRNPAAVFTAILKRELGYMK